MKNRWKIAFAICLINLFLVGCVHKIEIINPEVKAGKMLKGQSYKAPMDGWFISDEGVAKMLTAIEYFKYMWQECEEK
jgi:hypothetical protein